MSFVTRRKALPALGGPPKAHGLKPTLSWPHLVALGVGAIVGTGIYTLIGVGAERAGPAVMLAFVIAGIVCVCAALAYAELATMIPESGSAYTYSYTTLGEGAAWMVGWCRNRCRPNPTPGSWSPARRRPGRRRRRRSPR